MCGIVALLVDGVDISFRKPLVSEMLDKISHRGPDGTGIDYVNGQALLGHCRLAVIDVDHGQQPMTSGCGRYKLVFNGEIYNYLEMALELRAIGVSLKTASDTEVLLQLLIHRGIAALPTLNGMFSFVFHDRQSGSWIAARDHFGIKPLYYSKTSNELIFSSEIKAILCHPEIHVERDDKSLEQYMSFQFCLDDRTLFKNVLKIEPGHYLTGSGNRIESNIPYWKQDYQVDYEHTEAWFKEKLLYLLEDSTMLQMRSDVPVGSYVSGGIDSSLVAILASRHSDGRMPVFHGRFIDGPQYDESKYAKILIEHSNCDYFEVVPTDQDFVDLIPKLIYALDEPLAGPGVFPQYLVSKLAAEHVKVVLGGQGGDEIFGGYARYLIGYLEQALKGAIFESQEEGNHLVTLESIVPNLAILKEYTPLIKQFWSRGLFDNMDSRYFHLIDRSKDIKEILNPDLIKTFNRDALFSDFQRIFNNPETTSYINKMTYFDQKTLLPALLQVEDRVSMAHSIESRVPLLDYRIMDLVTQMPPQLKFQGGKTKHILKKSVSHILPKPILNRKDKMGFPVPLAEWMRGGVVREFVADTLLSRASVERNIYTKKSLERMISHQGVGSRQLWGALSLEIWHRQFIDA